ncbi:LacI family DNA-binding transcriptional regulator [uncultured Arcticibacterium sp.]|uniref:LacI family DNA-binding transcriptional regulator n=1 Tax=uncultured Arcticibacterium sp. TaxID=2173042 RepID=UPI0030FB4A4E
MDTGKVTIHDIARRLNIDSSTVSRALNDSPRVSQKTKDKISEMAQSMGYQRNLMASNLRKNVSNSIGVVVPRISRHFFSSVIQGIEETAYNTGYSVFICQSLEELERERNIIKTLVANRVDGVLISISMETSNYDHFQLLNKQGVPYVFFDRHCDIVGNNNVIINDFKGGYDATKHLISKGCKSIIHFSGPGHLEIYKNRLGGYKEALIDSGFPFKEEHVISSKLMESDGIGIIKSLLEKGVEFDGIFCANDHVAIGAIKFMNNLGIKIPEEVAIVGFNNEPVSNVITPSLTTIHQPGFEMGIKAAELLIKNMKNQNGIFTSETIMMDTNLIERNSSRR